MVLKQMDAIEKTELQEDTHSSATCTQWGRGHPALKADCQINVASCVAVQWLYDAAVRKHLQVAELCRKINRTVLHI